MKAYQSRLSSTATTNESEHFSFLDGKIDSFQNFVVGAHLVREMNIFQFNVSLNTRNLKK